MQAMDTSAPPQEPVEALPEAQVTEGETTTQAQVQSIVVRRVICPQCGTVASVNSEPNERGRVYVQCYGCGHEALISAEPRAPGSKPTPKRGPTTAKPTSQAKPTGPSKSTSQAKPAGPGASPPRPATRPPGKN